MKSDPRKDLYEDGSTEAVNPADYARLTEKHLAGGKFDHDQASHGYRYGANMSYSRLRRMARQDPARFADYKDRARARAAGGSSKPAGPVRLGSAEDVQQVMQRLNAVLAEMDAEKQSNRAEREAGMKKLEELWEKRSAAHEKALLMREAGLTGDELKPYNDEVERWNREWSELNDKLYIDPFDLGKKVRAKYEKKMHEAAYLPAEARGEIEHEFLPIYDRSTAASPAEFAFEGTEKYALSQGIEFMNRMVHKDLMHTRLDVRPNGSGPPNYRMGSQYVTHNEAVMGRSRSVSQKLYGPEGAYINKTGKKAQYLARAMVHEAGHHVELTNPSVNERLVAWLRENTVPRYGYGDPRDPGVRWTGFHYRERKKGQPAFEDSYMGKTYHFDLANPGKWHTELLSQGLDLFFTDPIQLVKEDPGFFAFLLSVIRGGGV